MQSPRERIAIVTTSYPEGPGDAAGHFVATEARLLARAGKDVTVLAAGADTEIPVGEPNGLCVVRLWDGGASGWPGIVARLRANPLRALGLSRYMLGAWTELQRRGPFNRVIAHWLVPAAFPIALAAPFETRIEVVVHGSDARLLAWLPRPVSQAIISRLLQREAEFRCVSEELSSLVRALAGPNAAPRIRVEASPISMEGAPTRVPARRELGIESGARLILIVSRLVREKRVQEALAAAHLVPDAEVVVVGDGPESRELQLAFPKTRFVGRTTRATALTWIAAADVVLSASRHEGAPTVLREARALGVPVVAVAAGDLQAWAEQDPGIIVI